MTVVYTGGTFDLLHVGHLELLAACRALAGPGGRVVASLNRDEFILRYKGKPPVYPLEQRLEIIRALRDVDLAVVNIGDEDSRPAIEAVRPGLIAIGADWLDADGGETRYHAQLGVTAEWLRDRGLEIRYIARTRGTASSDVRRSLSHDQRPRTVTGPTAPG